MKCSLFVAIPMLPSGAHIDLTGSPFVCLDYARMMKGQMQIHGQDPLWLELAVFDGGETYAWQWNRVLS